MSFINPAIGESLWKLSPAELSAALYGAMFDFFKTIYPLEKEIEEEIVRSSSVEKFRKGSNVLNHGQICRNCYFAGCGLARAYYITDDGEGISSWFMKEGDIIIAVQSFF